MKKILLFALVALLSCAASAHELTHQEALSNALNKLNKGTSAAKGTVPQASMTLSYTENGTSSTPLYYVFSQSTGGFLIAGADSRSTGLLGYTDNGDFDSAKENPAFLSWLNDCTAALQWLSQQQESSVTLSNSTTTLTTSVAPLLTCKWNQGIPYQYQCPKLTTGEYSATGCAATATAQVMYYYKWPETGTGSHTNSVNKENKALANPSDIIVDFTQSTYNWSHMKDTYTGAEEATDASAIAVSKLMADIGCAEDMEYGIESGTGDKNVVYALTSHFGYDKSMQLGYRKYFSSTNWNATLREELDNSRPVIMCAYTTKGGHAFVIDGYDTNGYYHVNWGWGGVSNGYFDINYMNPDEQGIGGNAGSCYNFEQTIIYGIKKDETGTSTASPSLRLTSQIAYDEDTKEFSYTVENQGVGSFTGQIGFVLVNSSGRIIDKSYTASQLSLGAYTTLTYKPSSSVTYEQYYTKAYPVYRLNETDKWIIIPSEITAERYLVALDGTGTSWGYDYGYSTPNLEASNVSVTRGYVGFAPKFHLTVSNPNPSSEYTTVENNTPIYVVVYKSEGSGNNATKTLYCTGQTQLFLEPGEEKSIDVVCDLSGGKKSTTSDEYYSYTDLKKDAYSYSVYSIIGAYIGFKIASGIIDMSTPAVSNISYSDFGLDKSSLKQGETLTASFTATNTGGFDMKDYRFYIFKETGGTSVDYAGITADILGNGTANNVSMSKQINLDPGKYHGNFYIKANGSYTPLINSKKFEFTVTGTTPTAINGVTEATSSKSAVIYNATGRRVQTMKKGGLYIVNGKKVIY